MVQENTFLKSLIVILVVIIGLLAFNEHSTFLFTLVFSLIAFRIYLSLMPYIETRKAATGYYFQQKPKLIELTVLRVIGILIVIALGVTAFRERAFPMFIGLLLIFALVGYFIRRNGVGKPATQDGAYDGYDGFGPGARHHGTAHWADNTQLKATGNQERSGLSIGNGNFRNKQGHLLTVAGSGQGKGTCLIIPTLLSQPNSSFVVTDPKGENAFITARFQHGAGQRVYILDPWDEQGKLGATHGVKRSGFNPFDFIKKDMSELNDTCLQIAQFLIPDKPDVKDPYWNDRARNMIRLFLLHIITSLEQKDHNFWTLYRYLRLGNDDWIALLLDMKENEVMDGLISIGAEELIGLEKSGNTIAGIKSTAQNATSIFESSQLRQSLETNDFDPYDLTNGKCTVYIVIPERFLDTHSVWLRLVIGLCLKACNSRPDQRVTFLLDEFPVMGKMKDVQRGYAFARGQNIVLWSFVQSLSQLKDIYGEDGMNNFISNAAVFQAFGLKDHFTTDYVSKLLGDGTFAKTNISRTDSINGTNTVSSSLETFGRPLMKPDEIERFTGIVMLTEGFRFKLEKQPYFKSPHAERADRPPRQLV